jgi:16S rRNA processing protein RimM
MQPVAMWQIFKTSVNSPMLLKVGKILSPFGIQGDIHVRSYTDKALDIASYGDLQDEQGRTYSLKIIRIKKDGILVVRFSHITNRTQAEALKGTDLLINRSQLPNLSDPTEYYYTDLEGLIIPDFGVVISVENYGAGTFLTIETLDKNIHTIPFHQEAIPHVDMEQKTININKDFLI